MPALRRVGIGFNISAAMLVLWLTIAGCAVGFTRYQRMPVPNWVATANPTIFASTGIATAAFLAAITALMGRAIWSRPTRVAKEIPVIEVQRIVLAQSRSTPITQKRAPQQEPASTR
jgi:TRAP-type C4-dicarboxylate transport system permease small subunit